MSGARLAVVAVVACLALGLAVAALVLNPRRRPVSGDVVRLDDHRSGRRLCLELQSEVEPFRPYACTRPEGHDGPHVASLGGRLLAAWGPL